MTKPNSDTDQDKKGDTSQNWPSTVGDLSADPANPREISKEAASGLGYSLEEFGDISGITFNVRSGQLVAGHQRIRQIFQKYGPLPIQRVDDSHGQIVTKDGQSFFVRFVDWDEEKQRSANIAANSSTISGKFVDDKLELFLSDIRESRPQDFDAMLFDELFNVSTIDGDAGKLKDLEVVEPPKMAWVLIGIPIVNYAEISSVVEAIAENEKTVISTTANNG
ncbi:MAG: hypothetical protein R3C03_24065 [Pirellulaceae bacterium]